MPIRSGSWRDSTWALRYISLHSEIWDAAHRFLGNALRQRGNGIGDLALGNLDLGLEAQDERIVWEPWLRGFDSRGSICGLQRILLCFVGDAVASLSSRKLVRLKEPATPCLCRTRPLRARSGDRPAGVRKLRLEQLDGFVARSLLARQLSQMQFARGECRCGFGFEGIARSSCASKILWVDSASRSCAGQTFQRVGISIQALRPGLATVVIAPGRSA